MISSLIQQLEEVKTKALSSMKQMETEESLYEVKVRFWGKKGELTDLFKQMGGLPPEDRPAVGAKANEVRSFLEEHYSSRLEEIKQKKINSFLANDRLDVTLPGFSWPQGSLHPVSQMLAFMKGVFRRMGFDIFEGPEIETEYYNFEALNIPADHPARDLQDTFYLHSPSSSSKPFLLRTHTSPVQIHVMESSKPPIQMIAPGVVYRCDSDVSHTPMFHQIEGLVVDKGIKLTHLKGIIEAFLREIFEANIGVRFRPSYFQFTEPSAEVDIACVFCKGKGGACRICKGTGWLEILGCGLVDPAVFAHVKINPEVYSGFAFGIGIERVTMLKYGINDLRLFFQNQKRFLNQF